MLHLTAGIFGNAEFAKKLGKQGTANDLIVYNHGSSEGVFTYVAVNSEKVQSLLQAINMIDVPVFVLNELNAVVGEQIVAVAEFGFEHGFFILEGVSEEQIKPIIKGTCLENFSVVAGHVELTEELKKLNIHRLSDKLKVPIDNYFDVKSVGTVILGIVKSGTVKKYDKVIVEPIGTEVTIKGIQSQDKDIESADAGTRVGLNLKGIEADDLKRGYVVGSMEKTKHLKLNFSKSKYTKEHLKENDPVFVCSGLQVVVGKIAAGNPLTLDLESTITYDKHTKFLIASTKQAAPRIIGHGTLAV